MPNLHVISLQLVAAILFDYSSILLTIYTPPQNLSNYRYLWPSIRCLLLSISINCASFQQSTYHHIICVEIVIDLLLIAFQLIAKYAKYM